jgi:hypothetical protein
MPNFFKKHKNKLIFAAILGVFFALTPTRDILAQNNSTSWLGEKFLQGVGGVIEIYVKVLGQLSLKLVEWIIVLASYNNFVNFDAVATGWVVVRDVTNMFFIVILLVIAFATIFDVGDYKMQKLLPRLLIMAVVVNFSRTICGLFIDLGQVVMLTFTAGFRDAAGGNFINALGIDKLLKLDPNAIQNLNSDQYRTVIGAFFLAGIFITITAVVLAAMALILVMRIVALWFLIVLSPIAFLSKAWPSGRFGRNYGVWWDMFLDNILIGPILAFFLWLSLLTMGNANIGATMINESGYRSAGENVQELAVAGSAVGTLENMAQYMMGIGMLMMSLYMAMKLNAVGSGIAREADKKLTQWRQGGVAGLRGAGKWTRGKITATAGEIASRNATNAGVSALNAFSKVPLVGGLAMGGLNALQARQKKQAQKDTAGLSGLTADQKKLRLKQLESFGGPLSDSAKNQQKSLINSVLIRDLERAEWKPNDQGVMEVDGKQMTKDEWFEDKRAKLKRVKDMQDKVRFPENSDRIDALEKNRISFGKKEDVAKAASELDYFAASRLSAKEFDNDDVIANLGTGVRDQLEREGSQAVRKKMKEWKQKKFGEGYAAKEANNPAEAAAKAGAATPVEVANYLDENYKPRLDKKSKDKANFITDQQIGSMTSAAQTPEVLSSLIEKGRFDALIKAGNLNMAKVNFTEQGGAAAKAIAASGNEDIKRQARFNPEYEKGLTEAMKAPGDHRAARTELLTMGKDISSVYAGKVNAGGGFADEQSEIMFKGDIRGVAKSAIPGLVGKTTGEAQYAVLESLSANDVKNMLRKTSAPDVPVDKKQEVESMIQKFIVAATQETANSNMQKELGGLAGLKSFDAYRIAAGVSEDDVRKAVAAGKTGGKGGGFSGGAAAGDGGKKGKRSFGGNKT